MPDLTATAADELTQLRTGLPRRLHRGDGRAYALLISEQHRLSGGGITWAVVERETGRFVASVDSRAPQWGHTRDRGGGT
ncbi:hypothetical protein GCM10020219_011160 [Nonomuraea dietziae]